MQFDWSIPTGKLETRLIDMTAACQCLLYRERERERGGERERERERGLDGSKKGDDGGRAIGGKLFQKAIDNSVFCRCQRLLALMSSTENIFRVLLSDKRFLYNVITSAAKICK